MALLARLRPRDAARKKLKSRIQGTIVARPRSVSPVSPKVDHLRVDQEIGQIFARGRTCLRERFAIPLFEATHPTAHPLSLSNGSVFCPTGRTTRLHTRSYSPGVLRDDIGAAPTHEAPPDSAPTARESEVLCKETDRSKNIFRVGVSRTNADTQFSSWNGNS